MSSNYNVDRDVDIEYKSYMPVEDFLKLEGRDKLFETIAIAAMNKLEKEDDLEGVGIGIEFTNFSDEDGKPITEEQAKADFETSYATIVITAEALQNGKVYGGYIPPRGHEEDYEPPEFDGRSEEVVVDDIADKIEETFAEFNVSIEIDDKQDNSAEWEKVDNYLDYNEY